MAEENKFNKVKYNNDFNSKAYDRINLTVPKGKKEQIQHYAAALRESVNGFINAAIDEKIVRDFIGEKEESEDEE